MIANVLNLRDDAGVDGKNIAGPLPENPDGNAWGDPEIVLRKPLATRGYTVVDPGRYQAMNNDLPSQIVTRAKRFIANSRRSFRRLG